MTPIPAEISLHPVVRAAVEALGRGDRAAWAALFEPDALLFDDDQPRDLAQFNAQALGHERFTGIDRVSADGLLILGTFHAGGWGELKAYFRFRLSAAGRIQRLDIGQARWWGHRAAAGITIEP
ncbi:MAG: hypothetical protein KA795_19605 [Burkholderiaceae bacterium]|nr:hypothetical protein [Burkholderiaceae bacterium]